MRAKSKSIRPTAAVTAQTIDVQGFSLIWGKAVRTILNRRHRDPLSLPPAVSARPLRWRVETVKSWIEEQERADLQRARASLGLPHSLAEFTATSN